MLTYVKEVEFIGCVLLTTTLFGVGHSLAVTTPDLGTSATEGNDSNNRLFGNNGIIRPNEDYIYEHFYTIAVNCYRFVDTVEHYEAQTNMYPKNSPEIFQFDVLTQVHIDVTLHSCETILDVMTAYYNELKKRGEPIPYYVYSN